jgi:hypothetical protein
LRIGTTAAIIVPPATRPAHSGDSTLIRPRRTALGAASLLILTTFIAAACGGSAATTLPDGAEPTPVPPDAVVTPTPVTPDGVEVTPEIPAGAIPSFDISGLVAGLDNVDSYRVSVTSDGEETFAATVVTKPTLSRRVTAGGTTFIVIGSDTWISEDGTTFQKDTTGFAGTMLQAFDPSLYIAAFASPAWTQSALSVGTEDKNGVSATHYRIDSSTLVGGLANVPADAVIDLWIANDSGILVAWESTGFGGDEGNFAIQVTNIDDPANTVEAPN